MSLSFTTESLREKALELAHGPDAINIGNYNYTTAGNTTIEAFGGSVSLSRVLKKPYRELQIEITDGGKVLDICVHKDASTSGASAEDYAAIAEDLLGGVPADS